MKSGVHLSTFWRLEGHLEQFLSILVKLSNINENLGVSNYWSYAICSSRERQFFKMIAPCNALYSERRSSICTKIQKILFSCNGSSGIQAVSWFSAVFVIFAPGISINFRKNTSPGANQSTTPLIRGQFQKRTCD